MSAQDTRSWTTERAEQLRALWTSGLSAAAIAERLGATRSAVIGKANRMGLSPHVHRHRSPRADMARLADMLAGGATIRAACAELLLDYSAGRRLFGRMQRELGWQAA